MGNPRTLSDALLERRSLKEQTLEEAAEESGISAMTLSRYEHERTTPQVISYKRLCVYLDLPLEELIPLVEAHRANVAANRAAARKPKRRRKYRGTGRRYDRVHATNMYVGRDPK